MTEANCHDNWKIDETTLIRAGILLAAANMPDNDNPENKAIIYLDEILVIHHDSILGVRGRLKAIIPLSSSLLLLLNEINQPILHTSNRYKSDARFATIKAKR